MSHNFYPQPTAFRGGFWRPSSYDHRHRDDPNLARNLGVFKMLLRHGAGARVLIRGPHAAQSASSIDGRPGTTRTTTAIPLTSLIFMTITALHSLTRLMRNGMVRTGGAGAVRALGRDLSALLCIPGRGRAQRQQDVRSRSIRGGHRICADSRGFLAGLARPSRSPPP